MVNFPIYRVFRCSNLAIFARKLWAHADICYCATARLCVYPAKKHAAHLVLHLTHVTRRPHHFFSQTIISDAACTPQSHLVHSICESYLEYRLSRSSGQMKLLVSCGVEAVALNLLVKLQMEFNMLTVR